MDMKYHVRGTVFGVRYNRDPEAKVPTIITIVDASGTEWECPWGIDPNVPKLGDEVVLGCKVVEEAT